MNHQHLRPSPPTGQQNAGNRSPRVTAALRSPVHAQSALTSPRAPDALNPPRVRSANTSVPTTPSRGAAPTTTTAAAAATARPVVDTARVGRASAPDHTAATDWSVPTHSRSPAPIATTGARHVPATTRGVARSSDAISSAGVSSVGMSPPHSAAHGGSASRVYRSDGLRASNHGLHTGQAVPSYLGVLSPPADGDLSRRTAGSMPRGASTASGFAQPPMGSLNESWTHHYTNRGADNGLFDSSTSSSGNEDRNEDDALGVLDSPTEVMAHGPPSGVVVSSSEGSFGGHHCGASGDGSQDDLDHFFSFFIERLPLAWSRPLLRALTLQVATVNVPSRVLTVSAVFDLYDDIKGELLGQLRASQKEAVVAAAAAQQQQQLASRSDGDVDQSMELLSTTHQPGASRRAGRVGAGNHGPLQSASPPPHNVDDGSSAATAPAQPTLNLYRLSTVAPAIMRYRFNSLREAMYADMLSQYEVAVRRQEEQEERGVVIPEESRFTMPTRQEIVNCLSRPHPKDDVLFGAHLVQCAPRRMEPGAHLFHSATSDDLLLRSSTGTPTRGRGPADWDSTRVQSLMTGGGSGNGNGSGGAGDEILSSATVSYEAMPSIFLKGAVDLQLHMSRHQVSSLQSMSRGAMRPRHAFFTREFLATMASGGDGACLFATTFIPEFLVGLGSFIDHPQRAVRDAIRATLHRLNVLLGTELMRTLAPPAHVRERLRAPPLDLSLLYLRENDLHVANTPGLESKLFFITNSVGAERLVLDLDDQYVASSSSSGGAAGGAGGAGGVRRHLGDGGVTASEASMASSYSSIASMANSTTFEMPALGRSQVDLSYLCMQVVSGPRHGGEGASSSNVALFYHSCRGGLSQNTIPMIPGDYHRARRSRHHEGQTTTEPLLPLVVITATSEFWSVMPSRVASDLLRALVLLNEEAMLFPHGGLEAIKAERQLRGTPAWTSTMESERFARNARMEHVLNYIRRDLVAVFDSGVRERLCEYFKHRVEHFRELDTRNVQSMPEKLCEKLEQAAAARQARQQNDGSAPSDHASRAGLQGVTDSAAPSDGSASGADTAYTRRVCDAIASALVAEAEELAKQAAAAGEDDDDVDAANTGAGGDGFSATRILLGDVAAGSSGESASSARRSNGSFATGAARRSVNSLRAFRRPAALQGNAQVTQEHPFSVSVTIIPSAPASVRSTSNNRRR